MSKLKLAIVAAGVAFLASSPAFAFGDMGKAPTLQGTYVSGEGGFLHLDDNDIAGFGIGPVPRFKNVFVSPDNGWFAGGMIGYASLEPLVPGTWFKRIEFYALFGSADDSASKNSGPSQAASLSSVDAAAIIAAPNSHGRASASRDIAEYGLRFERDSIYSDTSSITWVLSPFIRTMDEDATGACDCAKRSGDVDDWMYGILFAAEPERWVTPGVALVGRLGAGIYGFDADGTFRSRGLVFGAGPDPLAAHVSDSDSGVGFRGQLGAGLKFKVWQSGMLETFAEWDYFSDVPGVFLPSNNLAATPAHVDSDDLWELRTGARLTFALGGSH